jgi:SagB-type dehydrogenase family enzyme
MSEGKTTGAEEKSAGAEGKPAGATEFVWEAYRRTAYPGRPGAKPAETFSPLEAGSAEDLELPPPLSAGGPGLWDALRLRRSVRRYDGSQSLELGTLGQLLWAACGRSGDSPSGRILRTAPSAGARYPIELYPIVNRVKGLRQGIYHYKHAVHRLTPLAYGQLGGAAGAAAMEQDSCREAAAVIGLTAVFERTISRYEERALRYLFLDAGHVAGNLALAAAGLGLGSCMVGAFFDDQVNELFRANGQTEAVLYMVALGHPLARPEAG